MPRGRGLVVLAGEDRAVVLRWYRSGDQHGRVRWIDFAKLFQYDRYFSMIPFIAELVTLERREMHIDLGGGWGGDVWSKGKAA